MPGEYICPHCGNVIFHSNETTFLAMKNVHVEICPMKPKPPAPTPPPTAAAAKPAPPTAAKPAQPAPPAPVPTPTMPPLPSPKPTPTAPAAQQAVTVAPTAAAPVTEGAVSALEKVGYNPKPIDPEFHKHLTPTGEHNGHKVYGGGVQREDADGKPYPTKLGVHGHYVGVDWEACIADGACMDACPVNVFAWLLDPTASGKGKDVTVSPGTPEYEQYLTDKSDPLREADCIFCMACETVCPTVAIKITPK